jgi:hypothetical protein
VRIILPHRVRAVHRVWQTAAHGLGFSRQAKPLQIEGAKNYTHRLASFHPTRPTFCDRFGPQSRPLATPSSRCPKDPAISVTVGDHAELYDPTSYGACC